MLGVAVLIASWTAVATLGRPVGAASAPVHIAVPPAADLAPAPIAAGRNRLRVCADPNNMPFSNQRGEGFENEIAALLAGELHRDLEYYWLPQRRGFVRTTLREGRCDVIVGVPVSLGGVRVTRPYYRSRFVFVSRRDRHIHVRSLEDAALRRLRIGIQITGTDYDNPPAAQALAVRHIIDNVRGYTVYGDYSQPNPSWGVLDAVTRGDVDIAIAWGPLAGYFAQRVTVPLALVPVTPEVDTPSRPFVFDIAMAVRSADPALAADLDAALVRRAADVRRILTRYGVPAAGQGPGPVPGGRKEG
jgi:mxaJ protein